ncbi:Hypothetical protein KLENKIAIHU_2768 [Klenkia terrae]|nr:Hypothetical protein KLENKIAIHU_2768 [Klenkia terrae]
MLIILAATGTFAPDPTATSVAAPPPTEAIAPPSSHAVTVLFTLSDSDLRQDCEGDGGYADIGPGTPVRLTNESGVVLGATSLSEGDYSGGTCTWTLTIPDVGDAQFYSIEVGDRGQITNSSSEMEASGWSFFISLG